MPDIPTWPETFPGLTQDYKTQAQDATLRSRMDSGYIRQRGRFTVDLESIDASWEFDDLTYRYFKSWFKAYLSMGAGWFYMPIALGGGMVQQKVRFVGSYQASYAAHEFWEVTGKLEVIDPSGLDPAALSLILNTTFYAEFVGGLEAAIITDYHTLIHDTFRIKLAL